MSDFAPIGLDERGQPVVGGGDARLWVKFTKKSRRNAFRSEQEGRPIYEPVDYVQIQQPGERDQLVRPVREEDKFRFPRQWAAYVADTEQVPDGTPIQMLFPNEPHIVELLRDLKILTVEQLAQLTEHGITRLGMDGRKYVQRALAAMDKSENSKEVSKLSRQLTDAQDRMAVLERANTLLQERLAALEERRSADRDDTEEEPRPRRGRPRYAPPPDEATPPPPPQHREQLVE
jgi:hypothetical protein